MDVVEANWEGARPLRRGTNLAESDQERIIAAMAEIPAQGYSAAAVGASSRTRIGGAGFWRTPALIRATSG